MHWVSKMVKAVIGAPESRADTQHEWQIVRKMKLHARRYRFFDDLRQILVFKVGKSDISSLFEEIPFCPLQGDHMTHVWEGSQIYKKISRTLWRSKPVSRVSCVRSDMV